VTVSELIETLRDFPQDAMIEVVEPEYWDGKTEHREPAPIVSDEGKVVL
jgi:hypothetical protein